MHDSPIPSSVRRLPIVPDDPDRALPAVNADPNDIGALAGEDDVQGLSRVLAEIGEEADAAKVIIYRLNPTNARAPAAWLDEITPAQFSIKWLADLYGGGYYNVRVYVPQVDANGNRLNRVQCAANRRIYLEGAPKTKKYFEDPAQGVSPHAAPGSTDTAAIVQAIVKSNEAVLTAIQANQAKPADPFDLFEKMARIKSLFASDAPKTASGLEQFREMMGMVKEIEETRAAGESGSGGMLMLLANKFLNRFEKLEAGGAEAPALPAPAAEPVPGATPAAPAARAVEVGTGDVTRMVDTSEDDAMFAKQMMELYLRRLIGKAKGREDPKAVAVEVAQQADVSLFAFLETETWFDEIVKINGNAALYKTFFSTLRDEVLRLAKEGLPPETPGS